MVIVAAPHSLDNLTDEETRKLGAGIPGLIYTVQLAGKNEASEPEDQRLKALAEVSGG